MRDHGKHRYRCPFFPQSDTIVSLYFCRRLSPRISSYLAVSALRFACSANSFSSFTQLGNSLASGGCSPRSALCACAHWSSLSSLPKSFFLVNAVCKTSNFSDVCMKFTQTSDVLCMTNEQFKLLFAQWQDAMLSHSENIG